MVQRTTPREEIDDAPATPGEGSPDRGPDVLRTPWLAGPAAGSAGPVLVSVTDFGAADERDLGRISELGLGLARSWPIMQGAVGVWLWVWSEQLRGGAVSVWSEESDLRRFVRWPVHAEIVREWRSRIDLVTASWRSDSFDQESTWERAVQAIHSRPMARAVPACP